MTGKILEEWQRNCNGCKYYDEAARTKGDPSCTSVNKIETDASGKACLNFVAEKQNHRSTKRLTRLVDEKV